MLPLPRASLALCLCLPLLGCPTKAGLRTGGDAGADGGGCLAGCVLCTAGKCQDCVPGQTTCAGGDLVRCNADGTLGTVAQHCDGDAGEVCLGSGCWSACNDAAALHSYFGCDYWPTTLVNTGVQAAFHFAVAVANPGSDGGQGTPATIRVSRGGVQVAQQVVQPGDVAAIELPWVFPLSQNQALAQPAKSVLLAGGAYHLTSTVPVTVYQFNPLEYELPAGPTTCYDSANPSGPYCYSYSNDATLLLPTPALQTEYYAVARQTFGIGYGTTSNTQPTPGFVAVVASQDQTTVTVQYTAYTESGSGVAAQTPGAVASYGLDAGDVLEVVSQVSTSPCTQSTTGINVVTGATWTYCDMGPQWDLTGTHITADKPIAVFGGHACSFVPYDKWACDHLETQLLPLQTWGKQIFTVQTEPQVSGEPNLWRILSGSAANTITFDPPTVSPPVTLDVGQYIELVTEGAFQVTGTGRVLVAQYMVGENYTDDAGVTVGDPSLSQGVPVEQFRSSYDFLTPSTYTKSYVNIIAPLDAGLVLDGSPVVGPLTPIGSSSYGWDRIELPPGVHHLSGDAGFGITVSGIASYTSYLYMGGLNLQPIAIQ